MSLFRYLLAISFLATSSVGCDALVDALKDSKSKKTSSADDDDDEDDEPKKKKKKKKKKKSADAADSSSPEADGEETPYLADIGFRPEKDGYAFRNTGGQYPLTKPVVDNKVMVKLFGKDACVKRKTKKCKLTPPAAEWAHMINRAINGGQCEGMAVSSLTFFKGHDKHSTFLTASTNEIKREDVTPLLGYYWAYQAVNPVMRSVWMGRRTFTPTSAEDKLVEMWKNKEYATIAFWGPPGQGGHAVTPFAIEDKGNGIHHIKIYDNNYPNSERYIEIDRVANTWKYDLAAINPSVPKMPWGGNADSHNFVIVPLALRLQKAQCPFCDEMEEDKKTIWPRSSSVGITDQEGRRIAVENGKLVNEIPGAEVIDLAGWTEDGAPIDPVITVPGDGEYQVTIGEGGAKGKEDERGVAVFGRGTAYSVEGVSSKGSDKDVLSIGPGQGGVSYTSATGRMPAFKVAIDNEEAPFAARIGNMQGDAGSVVELRVDRKVGRLMVGGGGKSTASYDLKLKHVTDEEEDDVVVEEKGVKFKFGEQHSLDTKRPPILKPGTAAPKTTPLRINRGTYVPKPRAPLKPKTPPKVDPPKGEPPKALPPKPGGGPPPPKPGAPLAPRPGLAPKPQ